MKTIDDLIHAMNAVPAVLAVDGMFKRMPPAGNDYFPQLLALTLYMEQQGWNVLTCPDCPAFNYPGIETALGATFFKPKIIWIKLCNPNWQFYALAHEIGHTTHERLWRVGRKVQYREVWAEGVSYFLLSEIAPKFNNNVAPAYLKMHDVEPDLLRLYGPYLVDAAERIAMTMKPVLSRLHEVFEGAQTFHVATES